MNQKREPIGPPPSRPTSGVQNLLKANRTQVAEPSTADAGGPPERPLERKQVTFYMSAEDRRRAKATFQGTSNQEMDASWSEFVTRAVMTEVLRRERVHNNGDQFSGGTRNLTPGRKLSP